MPDFTPEQPHEGTDVLVADALGDFGNAKRRRFEKALGGSYARTLQIGQRRLARFGLKAPEQRARAHGKHASQAVELIGLGQALVQPMLDGGGERAVGLSEERRAAPNNLRGV